MDLVFGIRRVVIVDTNRPKKKLPKRNRGARSYFITVKFSGEVPLPTSSPPCDAKRTQATEQYQGCRFRRASQGELGITTIQAPTVLEMARFIKRVIPWVKLKHIDRFVEARRVGVGHDNRVKFWNVFRLIEHV